METKIKPRCSWKDNGRQMLCPMYDGEWCYAYQRIPGVEVNNVRPDFCKATSVKVIEQKGGTVKRLMTGLTLIVLAVMLTGCSTFWSHFKTYTPAQKGDVGILMLQSTYNEVWRQYAAYVPPTEGQRVICNTQVKPAIIRLKKALITYIDAVQAIADGTAHADLAVLQTDFNNILTDVYSYGIIKVNKTQAGG